VVQPPLDKKKKSSLVLAPGGGLTTPRAKQEKENLEGLALGGGRTTPRLIGLGVAEKPPWPLGVAGQGPKPIFVLLLFFG
jgi:hypothetical protein